MTAALAFGGEERRWSLSALAAGGAHVLAAGLVLAWQAAPTPLLPDPVMVVELPEMAAAPTPAVAQPVTSQPDTPVPVPTPVTAPQLDIPPVRVPVPSDAVAVQPQPQPRAVAAAPAAPAPPPAARTVPDGSGAGTSTTPGTDPKAKKQEADYYALLSAHLNRKKQYPPEAKKARQQGVVAVRFTVDRTGSVSAAAIKRSSGHDLLDQATLDLLRRVSPLPAFPASMKQASATITVPIEYSLRTS